MVLLKLRPLGSILKSISYSLHNEAGGKIGIVFQFYAFLWIVITSFFTVTRILSVTEKPDPVYLASVPVYVVLLYLPIYIFWLYEKNIGIERRRIKEMNIVDSVNAEYRFSESVETGFKNSLFFRVNNPTEKTIENIWIRAVFPSAVICNKPIISLGSLQPMSSLCASISFVPLLSGNMSMGYYDLYFEVNRHKHQKPPFFFENINANHSYLPVEVKMPERLRFGHNAEISIQLQNISNITLTDLHVKCSFSNKVDYDTAFSEVKTLGPGSGFNVTYQITPLIGDKINPGSFEILFKIAGNNCKIGPIEFEERYVQVPEVNVRIKIPEILHNETGNTIGIYVDNNSNETIHNVCFNSCFSSFIECHDPGVCIPEIQADSSAFTSIVIKPVNCGNIDLGNLNFSFEVNEIICQKEPFDLGTHKVV